MAKTKKLDNYSKGFNTEALEGNEKKANQLLDTLKKTYELPEFPTTDDEIKAVIEFYEHRTSAIAKYNNETFVDSATESLKKRFAKRMVNKELDDHLRLVYEDMYKDVEATVQEKRAYYKKRITTEK